jgi:hypothetical protein
MPVKRVIESVHVVPMGMAIAQIFGMQRRGKGVHVAPMGMANAFLIEGDDGLTLIDAGFPGRRQRSSRRSAGLAVRQTSSST